MITVKNLRCYTTENTNEKRTKFVYVIGDNGFFQELDVEGEITLEMALSIVKEMMADRLIRISLKETVSKISAAEEEYEFMELDLRDMIFDIDIFDSESELYQSFMRLILKYWSSDFPLVYHMFLNIEDIKIHDDSDGKTLYRHYFEGLQEFRNGISFIEYVNSKVALPIVNDYLPYIDIDSLVDYYIIDPTVKRNELEYVLRQNNVGIPFTKDNESHWQAFGYCYAKDNDLSDLEALSFARLISNYISPKDTVPVKNKYIKENLIEEFISKRDFEFTSRGMANDEKIERIFYELFDIYQNQIKDYEYKNKSLNFRMTSRQYDEFMSLPGNSNTEKLENLIDFYLTSTRENDIDFSTWAVSEIHVLKPSKKL